MNCGPQMVALLLALFLHFFLYRGEVRSLVGYKLRYSSMKKLTKGQTVKDWFLYTRLRSVIPPIMLIEYFVIIALYFAAMITVIIMTIANCGYGITMDFCKYFLIIMLLSAVVHNFFYRTSTKGNWRPWIDKRKRYK